ncbi:MAG: ABC transporter permease [Bacillota bacterium]|nr:MAG: ABC transporter permease [Bacillota bacterium]
MGRSKAGVPFVIAGKELKLFIKDTQMLFFSLALPVVLIFLMVATFGAQARFHATAYVVNLDRGGRGEELVDRLSAIPELTVEVLDEATADSRLATSEIVNAIILPPGFSEAVAAGRAQIEVRRRGAGGTEGQIAVSYAAAIARELAGECLVAERVKAVLAGMGTFVPGPTVDARVSELFAGSRDNPRITVTEETVGGRPEPVVVFLPGLVTMVTLFSITLGAVGIVEERKKGTLERLMTTRLTRGEFLAGQWLGTLSKGLLQVVFLFGLAWVAFRIFTPASFAALLAFGVIAIVSVSGLGLVIAAISKTPEQANWIAVFFTMIMTVLGGSFFDVSGAKGALAVLSRLTYNFWANDGLRRIIVKGESLTSPAILTDITVLLALAAASWVVAILFFRLRGDGK